MKPSTVVLELNELEDELLRLPSRVEAAPAPLSLERGEEALDHGVVMAIPCGAHAHLGLEPSQVFLVGPAGILGAAIRVVQQALTRTSAANGHSQGIPRPAPGAGSTRRLCRWSAIDQPTTRRLNRSKTTAKYSHPSRVSI
jgi:hypothetical protein